MQEFTALDLLDAYLKLVQYEPHFYGVVTEEITQNPVSLSCFRRLETLANAFEVPMAFFGGDKEYAVCARQKAWGEELENQFAQEIDSYLQGSGAQPYDRDLDSFARDLGTVFERYCKFLVKLQALQRFNSDWLMASSAGAVYSILTTNAIVNSLDSGEIKRVRGFLARVLDPAGRSISKTELVERFGYPTESLAQLEGENM